MIHGLDVFVHLGCMLLGCLTAVVTALTYRLTYEYSTFCPHGVFVFCVDLRTNSVFTARYLYHFFFLSFRLLTKPLVTRSFVFQVLGFGWCDAPAAAASAAATTRLQRASGRPAGGSSTSGVQLSARPRGTTDRSVPAAPKHHSFCLRWRTQGHSGMPVPVPQRTLELYNSKR